MIERLSKYKPADEFILSETEIQAHLSGTDAVRPLAASLEVVPTHAIEAPSPFARPHTQA